MAPAPPRVGRFVVAMVLVVAAVIGMAAAWSSPIVHPARVAVGDRVSYALHPKRSEVTLRFGQCRNPGDVRAFDETWAAVGEGMVEPHEETRRGRLDRLDIDHARYHDDDGIVFDFRRLHEHQLSQLDCWIK